MKDASLAQVAEVAISQHDLQTVQDHIRTLFGDFQPAKFHEQLADFPWRAIATLNYDLIVERAFQCAKKRKLIPWISNNDRPLSQRTSPSDIYLLKLHGCITRIADNKLPLILTPDQYANCERGRENVYAELQQIASESTLIFIGTSLLDSDLRRLLLWLDEKITSRPRGYIIEPTKQPQVETFWADKRFTTLNATLEDFVSSLARHSTGIAAEIRTEHDEFPVYKELTSPRAALSDKCRAFLENDIDYVHPAMAVEHCDPMHFYKGFSQGWEPIAAKLDCPRRLCAFLLEKLIDADEAGVPFHLIRAGAGAGKTVLLRRIAWDAVEDLDLFCLYLRENADLDVGAVLEVCSNTDQRVHLIVDGAATRVTQLNDLLFRASKANLKLTVVAAERSNEWNNVNNYCSYGTATDHELFYLNSTEVRHLLGLLRHTIRSANLSTCHQRSKSMRFWRRRRASY